MIIDTINFADHDYHLITSKTSFYKTKIRIVKVKRGLKYEAFRKDSKNVEILATKFVSVGKKMEKEAIKVIEEMKEEMTNIVLQTAVQLHEEANIIIKGDTDGYIQWNNNGI